MMDKINRRRIYSFLIFLTVLLCAVLVFSSCGEDEEVPDDPIIINTPRPTQVPIATVAPDYGEPKTGGTLRIGVSKTEKFDPLYVETEEMKYCFSLVYDNFIILANDGTAEAGLAESWEIQKGTEYHFTLRKGVKWHDGSDFTSADVINTLDRISKDGGIYGGVLDGVKSYEADGDYGVVFYLNKANRMFIYKLDFPIVKESPAGSGVFVGTGPYKYSEKDAESMTYEINGDYWGKIPLYEKMKICFYETEREKYVSDCDVMFFEGRNVSGYSVRTGYTTYKYQGRFFTGLVPNLKEQYTEYDFFTGEPLYRDINIAAIPEGRQALYYCIDREKMINTVLSGNGTPCDWPVYSGFNPAFNNGITYSFNLDKAYELFRKIGLYYNSETQKWYLNAAMDHPVIITILALENNSEFTTICKCLREDFEKAGLEVIIYSTAVDNIAGYLMSKTYSFILLAFETGDSIDLSKIVLKDGEMNFSDYGNKNLETLFRGASVAENDTEMANINENIENILDAELPVIGLYVHNEAISISSRVRGFENGKYSTLNPLYGVCENWSEVY